jgi:hypothetical protein
VNNQRSVNTISIAKAALLANFSGRTNTKGYTDQPQDNLLPGIDLATVEGDLRRGDGDELGTKFCAVHSSSALAVNCFAPFKVQPARLRLLGHQGATKVEFERKLPIFRHGTAPNIDVWVEFGNDVIAVEAKLLEYFTPKKAKFSDAYDRLAPPESDSYWWSAYETAKNGLEQHLDRAQLIKHYFGLTKYLQAHPMRSSATLLYIYWQPSNADEIEECREHNKEIAFFADSVAGSPIKFRSMTYTGLSDEWNMLSDLASHANSLKTRYDVHMAVK